MQDNHDPGPAPIWVSEVLHRAAARIDARLDQQLSEIGLTSRQYLLLRCVAENNGINQIGLTELTGIDRSTMTDMVGRLVARGLLVRQKKTTDARAYAVQITSTGTELLVRARPMADRIEASVVEKMPPGIREPFLETMKMSTWR